MRIGKQAMIDISNCRGELINDIDYLKDVLHRLASLMHSTIVGEIQHQFSPYGITIIAIVADSHIAIHTWPEFAHVAIDIFSCKQNIPDSIFKYLERTFESTDIHCQMVDRKVIGNVSI